MLGADPVEPCVTIPCGHCGQTLQLSMLHLMPVPGIECLGCGVPVPLYMSGLLEDMRTASKILATYRRRLVDD